MSRLPFSLVFICNVYEERARLAAGQPSECV